MRGGVRTVLALLGALVLCAARPPEAAALKGVAPGGDPPPFSLSDLSGRVYSLEYFSGSGGALVFWSTWSPRSAEILEDFRRYHEELADKGLRILAVNIDGEHLPAARQEAVRAWISARSLPFPVLLDRDLRVFSDYGVMAHPSTVVIDREGKVAYTLGGYPLSLREELRESLLKVLGLFVPPPPEAAPAVGYVPKNGALLYYRVGLSLMAKGQTERALESFRKSSERDPDYFEPAVMAARLSLAAGDPAAAEELIANADAAAVNRSDLRFLAGLLLLRRGETQEAEAAFESLLERDSGGGWGQWGMGMALLHRDDFAGAAGKMREAAALQPGNVEAEAFLHRRLVEAWRRGASLPREDELVSLFPSLEELRQRYRRMFGAGGTEGSQSE